MIRYIPVLTIILLLCNFNVYAADRLEHFSIQKAMRRANVQDSLGKDIILVWGQSSKYEVERKFGSFSTSKRTSTFGKRSREQACGWALASALREMQTRAKKVGGNAVINISSNISNKGKYSEVNYQCLVGAVMVNTAIKGDIVRLSGRQQAQARLKHLPKSSHYSHIDPTAIKRNQDIQEMLIIIGYDPGPIDGIIGNKTRNAVKSFQIANNLEVTGEVDDTLFILLQEKAEEGKSNLHSSKDEETNSSITENNTYLTKQSTEIKATQSLSAKTVTVVPENVEIQVLQKDGDWLQVIYGNFVGYLYLSNGQKEKEPNTTISTSTHPIETNEPDSQFEILGKFVTKAKSELKEEKNVMSKTIVEIPQNSRLDIIGKGTEWLEVLYGGKRGFVYISENTGTESENDDETIAEPLSSAQPVQLQGIITAATNLLSGNSIMADVIIQLKLGESLEVLDQDGQFYKVKYGDKIGYVFSDFVEISPVATQ